MLIITSGLYSSSGLTDEELAAQGHHVCSRSGCNSLSKHLLKKDGTAVGRFCSKAHRAQYAAANQARGPFDDPCDIVGCNSPSKHLLKNKAGLLVGKFCSVGHRELFAAANEKTLGPYQNACPYSQCGKTGVHRGHGDGLAGLRFCNLNHLCAYAQEGGSSDGRNFLSSLAKRATAVPVLDVGADCTYCDLKPQGRSPTNACWVLDANDEWALSFFCGGNGAASCRKKWFRDLPAESPVKKKNTCGHAPCPKMKANARKNPDYCSAYCAKAAKAAKA